MPVPAEQRLSELLGVYTRPERVDVMRAKRLILQRLADGEVHPTATLINLLAQADGVPWLPSVNDRRFLLPLGYEWTDDEIVTREHAFVRWWRLERASFEAMAELSAGGLVVAIGGEYGAQDTTPRVTFDKGNMSSSVTFQAPRPRPVSDVVRIPHRLVADGVAHLDLDLFLADLSALHLDPRTERCLGEAIEAFRRELYLASASLLGATSEGAWFAAAKLLAPAHPSVAALVQSDRTAKLQEAVVKVLRDRLPAGRKWEADDLATQANLLRGLRNYGVHPRGSGDIGLDRLFQEETCGLLLLNAYQYLVHLVAVVAEVSEISTSSSTVPATNP